MNSLRQLYDHLSWRQRISLLAALLAVIGGSFWLEHWNTERKFKPLFSQMASDDAGAVIAKLKNSNTEYRLADGGSTILVEESKVAEVRLQLAAAGLPQSGRIGYELFDQANFGASEFTEQVNYHRAIEGELERSVMSLREVERARVHLTMAKESLYTENRQPAKASILIKLRTGAELSPQNVAAITQLAASAVPGLKPNQVTLVDTNGNLLSRPRILSLNGNDDAESNEGVLEYRKTLEHDIQAKVAQTLDPLLGPEHFRIGVSTEIELNSGDQSEELFDPEKAVIASSQTTQDIPAGGVVQAGVPGTSSNLPRPTASQASAAASTTNYGRRTENVNYQTSRTVRHTKLEQGGLKRMSVSILVDHTLRYEKGKPVIAAPAPEKLQVIKDVVAAAVGLNTMRGDQLVVESFPFESTLAAQPLPSDAPPVAAAPSTGIPLPAWLQKILGENFKLQDHLGMVGAVVGSFLLIVGGGIWWFLKRRKKHKVEIQTQLAAADKNSLSADAEKSMEARLAEQAAEQDRKDAEAILALKIAAPSSKKTDVLTKHIAAEIKRDPTAMAHVIRSWLNGEYQR